MIPEIIIDNDTAKELLIVLSFCDENFIENIPSYVIQNLNVLAANSQKEIYIEKNKSLLEQNISSVCKEFLSILYFVYMTDSNYKDEILNTWLTNDINN